MPAFFGPLFWWCLIAFAICFGASVKWAEKGAIVSLLSGVGSAVLIWIILRGRALISHGNPGDNAVIATAFYLGLLWCLAGFAGAALGVYVARRRRRSD